MNSESTGEACYSLLAIRFSLFTHNCSNVQRFCLALDLKDDPTLIAEYEKYHEKIWPEIKASIVDAGVTDLEIYRIGPRLFMILEAMDTFTFAQKAAMDAANPKVQEWETLMWTYQEALPLAKPGEKWLIMEKIFDLKQQ